MRYQNLFSAKNEKDILKCHLLYFIPIMLTIRNIFTVRFHSYETMTQQYRPQGQEEVEGEPEF